MILSHGSSDLAIKDVIWQDSTENMIPTKSFAEKKKTLSLSGSTVKSG